LKIEAQVANIVTATQPRDFSLGRCGMSSLLCFAVLVAVDVGFAAIVYLQAADNFAIIPILLGWFFAIMAASVAAHCRIASKRGHASLHWPTVLGQVIAAEIRYDGDGGVHPYIRYRYEVEGQPFESDTHTYRARNVDGYRATEYLARFPLQSEVEVAYDPNAPQVAVLETGPATKKVLSLFIMVAVVMFVVGIGILIDLIYPDMAMITLAAALMAATATCTYRLIVQSYSKLALRECRTFVA
jgi:hypothetical protein